MKGTHPVKLEQFKCMKEADGQGKVAFYCPSLDQEERRKGNGKKRSLTGR